MASNIFDVTGRNSLQPCYLVQALSLAGAEAEAGEIGKDYHHETSPGKKCL